MTRKTDEQRLEELQQAKDKLAARERSIKARLRSKERKQDARRKIIVGAIALEHCKHDKEWSDWLWQVLRNEVTREADREFLGLPPLGDRDRKRIAEASRKRIAAEIARDNETET